MPFEGLPVVAASDALLESDVEFFLVAPEQQVEDRLIGVLIIDPAHGASVIMRPGKLNPSRRKNVAGLMLSSLDDLTMQLCQDLTGQEASFYVVRHWSRQERSTDRPGFRAAPLPVMMVVEPGFEAKKDESGS